jgi:hypothetical protein
MSKISTSPPLPAQVAAAGDARSQVGSALARILAIEAAMRLLQAGPQDAGKRIRGEPCDRDMIRAPFLGFAPFPDISLPVSLFPAHRMLPWRPGTVSVLGRRLTAINERAATVVMVAVAPRGAPGPIGPCATFAASKEKGSFP